MSCCPHADKILPSFLHHLIGWAGLLFSMVHW